MDREIKGIHDNIHQTNCISKEDQRVLLKAHRQRYTDYNSRFSAYRDTDRLLLAGLLN